MDVDVIEDVSLVVANETTALNPSVFKMVLALAPVEQHAPLAGDQPALILDEYPQALERLFFDGFAPLEVFADGLEIQVIQREVRHREGVEAHPVDSAL